MIKDYEIRGNRGEEVLCLYLDFDTEFAKLGKKEKKKKFGELVSEFIAKNDIKFDGKKVAIISGGLLVATLLVESPSIKENYGAGQYYDQNAIVLVDENLAQAPDLKLDPIEIKKDVVEEKSKNEQQTASSNQKNDSKSEVNTSVPSKKTTTTPGQASTPATNAPVKAPPANEETPSTPTESVKQGVYVNVTRSNGTVLNLELEEYVIGVVGAEMPAAFNKEALKSQAVIARTYALKAIETGKTLTDDSRTQNYKSNDQLRAMWGSTYQTYYQKVKSAVQETAGMYLTYNSVIIDAVYHSTSNGRTEDAKYVWGNSLPYLVSVESPYDESNPSFVKETFLTYEQISAKLGISVSSDTEMQINSLTSGSRVESISIAGIDYSGVTIRNKLGLRSATFELEKSETGVTFVTKGYGHGVGLSQYGANGMANHGYDYLSILKHYYRGVNVSHL